MTELQMIRRMIPIQYKRVQEAMIEYKRSQSLEKKTNKQESLNELFRLIESELDLSCKFNSRKQEGSIR